MTQRIEHAIDIFLDALNKGTLAKGTCAACAVGNLVADGMGGKISIVNGVFKCDEYNSRWNILFMTDNQGNQDFRDQLYVNRVFKSFTKKEYFEGGEQNVSVTDFTEQELATIEFTFETNTKIHNTDYDEHSQEEIRADQIKGLEAVVKVMLKFDEVKEDVETVFTKKAELISI